MKRVKTFKGARPSGVDEAVNEFLSEPSRRLIDVRLSYSMATSDGGKDEAIVVMVVYEDVADGE